MIYRWWGNRNNSLVPGSPIALRAAGAYRALCTSFAGRQIDSGKPNFCSGSFTLHPANTSAITKIPMYLSTFNFHLSTFTYPVINSCSFPSFQSSVTDTPTSALPTTITEPSSCTSIFTISIFPACRAYGKESTVSVTLPSAVGT